LPTTTLKQLERAWVSLSAKQLIEQQSADVVAELVEGHIFKQSPSRIEELVKIFIHATKASELLILMYILLTRLQMECGFWAMGMGA
jgi:streptomycin 6-kinase